MSRAGDEPSNVQIDGEMLQAPIVNVKMAAPAQQRHNV
jgi:hypothetical protein